MITYDQCHRTFRELGLSEYSSVIIHYHPVFKKVLGNTGTVISALLDVLKEGNVFSYALFEDNREPYQMGFNELDQAETARKQLIKYDIKRFRDVYYDPLFTALSQSQGRLFSNHPSMVVCVNGQQSRYISRLQPLDFPFGKESAFESMIEMQSLILHIGDDFSDCHELRNAYHHTKQSVVKLRGAASGQQWQFYLDHDYNEKEFHKAIKACNKLEIPFGGETLYVVDYREACKKLVKQIDLKYIEKAV